MLEVYVRAKRDMDLNTGAGKSYSLIKGRCESIVFKNEAEYQNFINFGFIEDAIIEEETFVIPAINPGNSDIPVVGAHDTIEDIQEKLALKPEDLSNGLDDLSKPEEESKVKAEENPEEVKPEVKVEEKPEKKSTSKKTNAKPKSK